MSENLAAKDEKPGVSRLIKEKWHWLILVLLGILAYSNTFFATFHFDDELFILENYSLRNIHNLQGIWNTFPSRFITMLTFALNYQLHRFNVFGYHVFNLFIHIGSAILAGWLVRLIFSSPAMKENRLTQQAGLISLFVSLLFLTHPIQTESVTYIWQRCTSLAGFLYLLSLCLYLKSRLSSADKEHLFYGLAFIFAIAAMFSKESAVTLPLMIILCELMFFKEDKPLRWEALMPFLALLPIIPIVVFSTKPETFNDMNQLLSQPDSGKYYFLTQLCVWVTYIRLLFLPVNQNLDYDYPAAKSFTELSVLGSFLFSAALIMLAIRLYRKHRILSFGIFWFYLTLLPDSSIIPLKDLIFEHRLYLPMLGFSLFIVSGCFTLFQAKPVKWTIFLLASLVIAYSALTYQRNKVWENEFTLWGDIMRKSPQKVRSYNNRGNANLSQGNLDQAIAEYNKTLEISPHSALGYNNRGDAYLNQGKFDEAISDYSKAIEIHPFFTEAYYNRGTAYLKEGNLERAVSDFNKALEVDPNYAKAYYNRGTLYLRQGNLEKATSDYAKAIEIDPAYAEAYNNRGTIYLKQGNAEQAMVDFNKAIKEDSNYAEAYNNRGNIHLNRGDLNKALSDFNKALQINPRYANVYCNRGLLYEAQGSADRAISDYTRAIEINPDFAQAYYIRAVAYLKKQAYVDSWKDARKAEALGFNVDPGFFEELKKASGDSNL